MSFLPKTNKPERKNQPPGELSGAFPRLTEFRTYLTDTKGLKSTSVKNYLSDLRSFFRWQKSRQNAAGKNRLFSVLAFFKNKNRPLKAGLPSAADLQAYKNHLLAQKRAKLSINRRLASIRVFCQFCYDSGLSEQNPARNLTNLSRQRSQEKKINDLVSRFGAHLKKKGASRNTVKNYTADARRYLMASR